MVFGGLPALIGSLRVNRLRFERIWTSMLCGTAKIVFFLFHVFRKEIDQVHKGKIKSAPIN